MPCEGILFLAYYWDVKCFKKCQKSRLQNVRLLLATQVSISPEVYLGAGNTSSFTVFYILNALKYV